MHTATVSNTPLNRLEITGRQFDQAITTCREIFTKKNQDYGTAWRILRPSSLTDQILIKAQRIRSIEEKGTQRVQEGVKSEYVGIVNYCVMALIQLALPNDTRMELPSGELMELYDREIAKAKALMLDKNHDYDEAWRSMRLSSLTDLILMKLMRIKQIEDNQGTTTISEGIDANYLDMINYAIFALIRINE